MYGFQFCRNDELTELTSFRVELTDEFGSEESIEMSPVGPGRKNCAEFTNSSPFYEAIDKLEFFFTDNTIRGVQIKTATRTGQIGDIDSLESSEFSFLPDYPLVGLHGYTGADYINVISVIRYDQACQVAIQAASDAAAAKAAKEKDDDVEESSTATTVGVILGCIVAVALLVVIVGLIYRWRK